MATFAHIINPFHASTNSEAYRIQQVTFESMRRAREGAGDLKVDLFTVQYPEDHNILPAGFQVLPDLRRSVLDIKAFKKQRKLPLIKDILDALYEASEAEYFIFTNVDIILLPYFYQVVSQCLKQGHDALLINRRRIPIHYAQVELLPQIYAQLGRPHPGFDCFVFKREIYPKFQLESICVGIQFIGVALAHNLCAFSSRLKLIDDHHLSMHLGMEVMTPRQAEYYWHNRHAFKDISQKLRPHFDWQNFPYAALPWYKRWLKWGLNPSLRIRMMMGLEFKGKLRRWKHWLNEFRFDFLARK